MTDLWPGFLPSFKLPIDIPSCSLSGPRTSLSKFAPLLISVGLHHAPPACTRTCNVDLGKRSEKFHSCECHDRSLPQKQVVHTPVSPSPALSLHGIHPCQELVREQAISRCPTNADALKPDSTPYPPTTLPVVTY